MAKLNAQAVEKIARVMHETVRAWQAANGQQPAPPWGRAPQWMKDASITSILWRIENPDAPTSAQHDQWADEKRADGWKQGKVKSAVKKTHPLLVPYAQLSEVERRKDALVNAVVDSLIRPLR